MASELPAIILPNVSSLLSSPFFLAEFTERAIQISRVVSKRHEPENFIPVFSFFFLRLLSFPKPRWTVFDRRFYAEAELMVKKQRRALLNIS